MRSNLHGTHLGIHTDHCLLLWLLTAEEPTGQQARWVLTLQGYTFSIVQRPGEKNLADLPSRYPDPQCWTPVEHGWMTQVRFGTIR